MYMNIHVARLATVGLKSTPPISFNPGFWVNRNKACKALFKGTSTYQPYLWGL